MTLIDRLRIFFGLPQTPATNLVVDDIFQKFITDSTHQEGNAVCITITPGVFTEQNIGELLAEDLIYGHCQLENGDWMLYSDKQRLARFDLESLRQLEMNGIAKVPAKQWWTVD